MLTPLCCDFLLENKPHFTIHTFSSLQCCKLWSKVYQHKSWHSVFVSIIVSNNASEQSQLINFCTKESKHQNNLH